MYPSKVKLHEISMKIKRNNTAFITFVRSLSDTRANQLRWLIQRKTKIDLTHRWGNWLNAKASVPEHIHQQVNEASLTIARLMLRNILPELDTDNLSLNLFTTMREKTTIKVERAKLSVTQSELAKAVNVSQQAIANIESRKAAVRASTAIKIAQFFGKQVEDFQEFM